MVGKLLSIKRIANIKLNWLSILYLLGEKKIKSKAGFIFYWIIIMLLWKLSAVTLIPGNNMNLVLEQNSGVSRTLKPQI